MILRGDIEMTPGKACAKALQAGLNSFAQSTPNIQTAYLADGEGTQVILIAHSEEMARAGYEAAQARCVPCVMYEEAIGIGPVMRHQVADITSVFELFREGSSIPEQPPLKRKDEGGIPSPRTIQG